MFLFRNILILICKLHYNGASILEQNSGGLKRPLSWLIQWAGLGCSNSKANGIVFKVAISGVIARHHICTVMYYLSGVQFSLTTIRHWLSSGKKKKIALIEVVTSNNPVDRPIISIDVAYICHCQIKPN